MDISELSEKFPELKNLARLVFIARLHGYNVDFQEARYLAYSGTQDFEKLIKIGIKDYEPSLVNIWVFTLAHEIGHVLSNCDLKAYLDNRAVKIAEEVKASKIAFNLLGTYFPELIRGKNLLDFLNDTQFGINTYIRDNYGDPIEDGGNYDIVVFSFSKNLSKFAQRKVYKGR